jgi:hypothetical protein
MSNKVPSFNVSTVLAGLDLLITQVSRPASDTPHVTENVQHQQQTENHATDGFEPAIPEIKRHNSIVVPCSYVTCHNMPYKSSLT